MQIVLNGEAKDVAAGTRVAELIVSLGLANAAVAVEINKELVPKRLHAERELRESDRVEVVTLVGGG